MSARKWRIAENNHHESRSLAQLLGLPPLLAQILLSRGVGERDQAQRFLNPSLEFISDPFLLQGMETAVERLTRARKNDERVLIFGDYDVDGLTGTVLLLEAFRRMDFHNCLFDVPNRIEDGFGLKPEHIQRAATNGVQVIVTVDNGSRAFEAAQVARELGIDLIITDHHEVEENRELHALAFVNPMREEPGHPGRCLCGAGVAFKLAWAMSDERIGADLAAFGTIADVAPLRGENRDLTAEGLFWARTQPRPGIEALARAAGIRIEELDAEAIAYYLGPRINAAGRMGRAYSSLELLLTDSPAEANVLAKELDRANEERRQWERQIIEEAEWMIEEGQEAGDASIVLASRNWHVGVLGIAASRLQERYNRPVLLVAYNQDGIGRGSARGSANIHMSEALERCAGYLVAHGGHRGAAGFTIEEGCFNAFRKQFDEVAVSCVPTPEPPVLDIDAAVGLSEIDGRLVKALNRLEPFGHQNPAPVFCTFGVGIAPMSCREVGRGHLRLAVRQDESTFQAIGFNMADCIEEIEHASAVDIAFTPQFNTWRGETTIQLRLKDIRPAQS